MSQDTMRRQAAALRVKNGITLLDERTPGWHFGLNLDNIRDCTHILPEIIITRVERTIGTNATQEDCERIAADFMRSLFGAATVDPQKLVWYGFWRGPVALMENPVREWKRQIGERKGAA
ncbi:hypothetical protein [Microbispora sp. NPDC049125]|uniref:hypothetical protein n=1 Tax=Microbispora sp. NPDC049125 TaxID=3154929 RepID=UPI003467BAF0